MGAQYLGYVVMMVSLPSYIVLCSTNTCQVKRALESNASWKNCPEENALYDKLVDFLTEQRDIYDSDEHDPMAANLFNWWEQ